MSDGLTLRKKILQKENKIIEKTLKNFHPIGECFLMLNVYVNMMLKIVEQRVKTLLFKNKSH